VAKRTAFPVGTAVRQGWGDVGPRATDAYIEFFTATIRNRNTRVAYARACYQFFHWCQENGLTLDSNQILRSFIFGSDALAPQFSREPRICRSLTEVFGPMWLVRAYQPVVTMGFWMMGKLKTRIVIGYIFA
jgi:hypothetical protein